MNGRASNGPQHQGKRLFDIVFGLVAAILTAPITLSILLLSAAIYRQNPLFVHERVGLHGVPFRFAKIRTLPTHVGAYTSKFEVDTSRVPMVMNLCRRTHLDELPQLWLVVVGKMSLIGPRPEMPHLHDALDGDFARDRVRVRPGLTGLWQVSPHCVHMIGDHGEYDEFYVRQQNPWLDLFIIGATIRKMATGRTVALDQLPRWTLRSTDSLLAIEGGRPVAGQNSESQYSRA